MSRVSRWDYQLYQIERVIMELAREASLTPDPLVQDATLKDRDQIDLGLARISINLDKVNQAAKKAKNTNRTNAAIGWWSKQLMTKLKIVASEYVALQNRKMWLRLLQARFSGISSKDSLDLEAKHLVDLAVRKKHLDDLESTLRKELDGITKERDRLKSDYSAIGTADENWSASGSLQSRLGINIDHARQNPSSRALSECFSTIRVPALHPTEDAWLRRTNQELADKSAILAQQSRDLASALTHGESSADKLNRGAFRNSIEQLADLSQSVFDRLNSLRKKPVQVSRPKVVQSSKKADKTIAHP